MKQISGLFILLFIVSFSELTIANEHGKQDAHEHGGGHEPAELSLSTAELKEFSIKLAQVTSGVIKQTLDLTGEVVVEPKRLYHVVPRVSGVVLQVYKFLGDQVKAGDLLATLSSRELADAKARFVAADSLLKLANTTLQREYKLYREKITAESDYLAAKQAQAEMSINRQSAKQQLLALGLSKPAIRSILRDADKDLTLYELRAPVDGIIIDKHAVSGEVLGINSRSFTVADLSQVWVNLIVYQKNLAFIHQDEAVTVLSRFGLNGKELTTESRISWISPTLDEKTRSATARVVINNTEGQWRPGMFVSGKVTVAESPAMLVVPLTALQTIDGKKVVFIQHEDGDFGAQVVSLGRQDYRQVEILTGLQEGQNYVSKNAFTLKAQLQKGEFGEGHHH